MNKLSLSIAFFALLVAGCGSQSANQDSEKISFGMYDNASGASNSSAPVGTGQGSGRGGGSGGTREMQPMLVDQPAAPTASLDQTETSQQTVVPTDRKIIRNADLELESDDPESAQTRITQIAESKGGFVVESQQSSSDRSSSKRDTVSMTIRIPSDKFGETLNEIRNASGRVIVETIKGQDVTEEFIDIEARLKAQRALEAQFTEIMKRTSSVDEALNVQRQLAQVRGEIEKIEGRKRFLENQASLSTIKAKIQTPAVISAGGRGFFSKLTDSINDGLDAAMVFVLGLVSVTIAVLPFLLFICLPIYLVARYFWRRSKRKKTVNEIANEEIVGD